MGDDFCRGLFDAWNGNFTNNYEMRWPQPKKVIQFKIGVAKQNQRPEEEEDKVQVILVDLTFFAERNWN